MGFVFDRTAEGRVIKCLTVVDDATHEAVVIEVERSISGMGVTRVMDRLALTRGLQITRAFRAMRAAPSCPGLPWRV